LLKLSLSLFSKNNCQSYPWPISPLKKFEYYVILTKGVLSEAVNGQTTHWWPKEKKDR
jgi:hypothetical protein